MQLQRIQDIRRKGGAVEIDKPHESLLLPTKALAISELGLPKKKNPNDLYYDRAGKDIAAAQTTPQASGRCVVCCV